MKEEEPARNVLARVGDHAATVAAGATVTPDLQHFASGL
jgi:hypothetical protein